MRVSLVLGALMLVVVNGAQADIPPAERTALIALYNSTGGGSWDDNTNWLGSPGTECAWFGVSCAGGNNVDELNLMWNNLRGTIPSELGDLPMLRDLKLGFNHLVGTIPPEVGSLSQLVRLWLNNSQLTGPIPSTLDGLADLWSIDLRHAALTGTIPPELGNLPALYYLNLSDNQLVGTIPSQLGNLAPTLGYLVLWGNGLSGSVPASLTSLVLDGPPPPSYFACLDVKNFGGWNALYSDDPTVQAWLDGNSPSGEFAASQTTAPQDVVASELGATVCKVEWTPIEYTANRGGYRVELGPTVTGPFTVYGETADKTVSFLDVDGLTTSVHHYFRVRSVTYPHADNQSEVVSEPGQVVSCFTDPWLHPSFLSFRVATYRAAEGQDKRVWVRRSGGDSAVTISVSFSATAGSANAGVDFVPVSGTISWPPGDFGAKSFVVEVLDDGIDESDETVNLTLSNPSSGGVLVSPSVAVLTLSDNDFHDTFEAVANSSGGTPGMSVSPLGTGVAVWAEDGRDGSGSAVAALRYGSDGHSAGPQFVVNATTAGDQRGPAVDTADSGDFVVVWLGEVTIRGRQAGDGIFGRRFTSNGGPLGGEIQISETPLDPADLAQVAVRPATGSFAAVWSGVPATTEQAGNGIFGRYFTGSGNPQTGEIAVDDGSSGVVRAPTVAVNDSGTTVFAWTREDSDGWGDVFARRYDGSGNPIGPEILVNTDLYRGQDAPSVTVAADGSFAVAWQGPSPEDPIMRERCHGTDVYVRRFDSAGNPSGDPTRISEVGVSQTQPVVEMTRTGNCWAAWKEEDFSGNDGIFGRYLRQCGSPVEDAIRVTGPSGDESFRSVAIGVTPEGELTALYVGDDTVEGDGSVLGRHVFRSELFVDGFETGDTSMWTHAVP